MDVPLPDVAASEKPILTPEPAGTPAFSPTAADARAPFPQLSFPRLCVALVVAALAACWLSLVLSEQKFTGYDVSPLIDSGWRVLNGQVPEHDFLVTFPASLYLTVAAAYRLFGVTWHAIALMACVQYLFLLAAGLRLAALLRGRLGEATTCWLLAIYAVGQTILLVSINMPWHAAMAQSFGLYAVLGTLVLCGGRELTTPARVESIAHLAIAFAVLLISKPNTSFPVVAVCLVVLLRAGLGWLRTLVVCVVSVLLTSAALRTAGITLVDTLLSYRGLNGRLIPHGFQHGLFIHPAFSYGLGNLVAYALFVPTFLAVASALLRDRVWRRDPAALLAAGAMLTALIGMGTNFDFKLTDTPLLLMGMAILLAPGFRLRTEFAARQFVIAACGLLLLALYFGVSRYRMMWSTPDCQAVDIQDRFLGGMAVCPAVARTLGGVDAVLAREPDRDSVFFGPGLEYLYAARGIQSPRHLPAWWDLGTSYPVAQQPQLAGAWSAHRFHLVLLDPTMLGYLPIPIQRELSSRYEEIFSSPSLEVFRLRE